MKQHPVPQHIASYEFRLVGDMTLKQFGYLAGGIIVALIFYGLPLPFYFKWPGIIFFSFFGAALAFFPVEERPLSEWLIAFFRAVFSPTYYVWQKKLVPSPILKYQADTQKIAVDKAVKQIRPNSTSLNEYLQSLPKPQPTAFDQAHSDRLDQINQAHTPVIQATFTKPDPVIYQPPVSQDKPEPEPSQPPATTPVQPPFQPRPVSVADQYAASLLAAKPVNYYNSPGFGRYIPPNRKRPAVDPTINKTLPIPAPPSRPNILVGMVISPENQIVEGAILEIRNSTNMPVRALKTNQLGQFMIATPLENGNYEIETEKEGFSFDIIKIEVKGEIIPPIEIRAKARTPLSNA